MSPTLQVAALTEVVLCYIVWAMAFVGARKRSAGQKKAVRAPVSRWGMVLQGAGFALAWIYVRPQGFEKSTPALAIAMLLAPLSTVLGWAAVSHLGKYWRYEAALSEEHALIQSGPYRWLRHPIYASMLGLILSITAAWTWWPMAVAALAAFAIGTEIRVRAEDRLLEGRFGDKFRAYRSSVRAYIPLLR